MPRNLDHPDPLKRLQAVRALRLQLDTTEVNAIREAREIGRTWGEIAVAMGKSDRRIARRWYLRRIGKE